MGIMYKLLKQRKDLERQSLIMDLTKSKDNSIQYTNQTHSNDIVHEDELLPKLATADNQFTAEHIVQLCKFLAEKSKRNNMLNKRLPSCASPSHSPTGSHIHSHNRSTGKLKLRAQYQRESSNSSQETLEAVNHVSCTRLPHHNNDTFLLESSQPHSTEHILADKLMENSNVFEELNQRNSAPTSCAQEKRDILLKIRHQIFERKRQREMMEQQLDVWRPW